MIEREIEKYLVRRVKEIGGIAYKFVSPGNAGVPDRLVCLPDGRVVFVELKSSDGRLTALQAKQIKRLEKLNQKVYVLYSREAVDRFISEVRVFGV